MSHIYRVYKSQLGRPAQSYGSLTTDLAISGPSIKMGMTSPSTHTSPSALRPIAVAQALLSALESAVLVVIVVLSLHEEAIKNISEDEKLDSPVSPGET
jgi:hypothetical protein